MAWPRRVTFADRRGLHSVADLVSDGLLICEYDRVVWLNRSMERMLPGGRSAAEGHALQVLLPGWTVDSIPSDRDVEATLRLDGPTGSTSPVQLRKQPMVLAGRRQTVVAVRSLQERPRSPAEPQQLPDAELATGNVGCAVPAQAEAAGRIGDALRCAVAEAAFELHYQPLLDLRSGQYDGAEALIRWRHPMRGVIAPAEFIPAAEETGLIVPIGAWVLRTACAAAAGWPDRLSVSANLSPVQLRDPSLARAIGDILDDTRLAPSRLELEITESVLIGDEERTLATLTRLRDLGVRISLDDFGTGYSSLAYLRRFPFDKIKIDQSFIRRTPGDRESAAIVRAIVSLGISLGLSTTAEGVETQAQREFVAIEGCTQGQGFLFGRPRPSDELPSAFRRPDAAIRAA